MKRVFLVVLLVLSASSFLLYLSQPDRSSTVPVLYWVTQNDPVKRETIFLFKQWLKDNGLPPVEVKIDNTNQDPTKKLAQGLAGVGADLFDIYATQTELFASSGMLLDVTEQARELGVVIKSKKYADDRIWISLELSTKGEFERFRRVDLAVKLGGLQLVTAPLEVTRSKPETISVGFFAHPSSLADSELQVVVDSRGSIVSQFKLRNFVNTKEISSKKAQKESTKAVHDQPASIRN